MAQLLYLKEKFTPYFEEYNHKLNSYIHVRSIYVPSDFTNIIKFGFKQHLTCDTCSSAKKQKKKAPTCRVTWKKQTRGEGKQTIF
jgi:hypothetical protein